MYHRLASSEGNTLFDAFILLLILLLIKCFQILKKQQTRCGIGFAVCDRRRIRTLTVGAEIRSSIH